MLFPRLRRPAALLALPLLVGALLLMHGLEALVDGGAHHGAGPSAAVSVAHGDQHAHDSASPVAGSHGHEDATPATGGDHCADCLAGHLMAGCVAVMVGVAGIAVARLVSARGPHMTTPAAALDRAGGLVALLRAPDPPWVRLAVMRC